MKILVNGEERSLSIIDRNSGCDWIHDLITAPNFWNDETEQYEMSEDDYNWWNEYITGVEKYEDLAEEMIEDGFDSEEIWNVINEAIGGVDLEDQPSRALEALINLDTNNDLECKRKPSWCTQETISEIIEHEESEKRIEIHTHPLVDIDIYIVIDTSGCDYGWKTTGIIGCFTSYDDAENTLENQ